MAVAPAANAAFSPLSLHVVLSLLAAGAGGATGDQLAATLGSDGPGSIESLHALAEQVVQLMLADGSGVSGPCVAFADASCGPACAPQVAGHGQLAKWRAGASA